MIYYVIVRPNWGTGGFAPTPVRADGSSEYNTRSADFKDWRDGTTLIEQKPEAMTWFQGKKADYPEIYKTYWERYQRKSPGNWHSATSIHRMACVSSKLK